MSQFSNDGLHVAEYTYDFAKDKGAIGAVALSSKSNKGKLPAGAVVVGAVVRVVAACTSGGSATVALGNSASAGFYMAATAVASLTLNAILDPALAATLVTAASNDDIKATIAVAALTAGQLKLYVRYHL